MEIVRVPKKNAECEMIEKKSRFIGHMIRISTAEEAADALAKIKKKHYDASHNVFAYLLRGGAMRFSDDGEPQGTAGMPVLEVLRRENITDALLVVTRYFGGVLLGAGGLARAYAACAKQALLAAGVTVLMPHRVYSVNCSYHDFKMLQSALSNFGVTPEDVSYGADVSFSVAVLSGREAELLALIRNTTAGRAQTIDLGGRLLPAKETQTL